MPWSTHKENKQIKIFGQQTHTHTHTHTCQFQDTKRNKLVTHPRTTHKESKQTTQRKTNTIQGQKKPHTHTCKLQDTKRNKFVTHLRSTHKENKQTAQRKQTNKNPRLTNTHIHANTQLSPKSVDLESFQDLIVLT